MKCHNAQELMDQYIDHTLTDEERTQFEEHIATCEECKASLEMLQMMNDALHDIPMVDLPEGFSEELHQKLEAVAQEDTVNEETNSKIIPMKKFYKKPWFKAMGTVAALLVIAIITVPMLTNTPVDDYMKQESSFDMDYGADMPAEAPAMEAPAVMATAEESMPTFDQPSAVKSTNMEFTGGLDNSSNNNYLLAEPEKTDKRVAEDNRKIIRNANMDVETTEYDQYLKNIYQIVEAEGGYIANQNSGFNRYYFEASEDNLRYMNITIRIPEERFEQVLDGVSQFGVVRSKNVNAEDITNAYRDTEAEVANLKITEERLRDILKSATETKDVLEIERELTRIRGMINNYTQTLVQWDRLVSLSTIRIYVSEVDAYEGDIKPIDPTLGERMQDAFNNSITAIVEGGEKLLINLVGFTPYLPFWIVVIIIGIFVYRFVRKRGK